MSKREKIIVLVMVLVVLYGGYDFFLASKPNKGSENPGKKEELLDKFVTDVAVRLKKKDISRADKYTIARARTKWRRDPFVSMTLPSASEMEKERIDIADLNVNFSYSGYMEMGNRKLAVIDGMEYMTGDELKAGGYIVNSISPSQVVIGIKGTKQTITLPVQESD